MRIIHVSPSEFAKWLDLVTMCADEVSVELITDTELQYFDWGEGISYHIISDVQG